MPDQPSSHAPKWDRFAFLGFPRRFNLEPDALEAAFLKLSREFHPDRFAGAEASERAEIQRASARVNDAYRMLRDRIARAEHVLALEGIERGSGEAKCPADLLATVFDFRERLMEGEHDGLKVEVRELFSGAEARLDELFRRYDSPSGEDERRAGLAEIREALDRRKFLAKLVREVEQTLGA